MTKLRDLRPRKLRKLMDLAAQSGMDVSDWPKYKRGATHPGANPKYCYEWVLTEPGKLVLCNLWFRGLRQNAGHIEARLKLQDRPSRQLANPTQRARRGRMESRLLEAYRQELPVRVVLLDGKDAAISADGKAHTKARDLDLASWAVVSVDNRSGEMLLRRGVEPSRFRDQFSLSPPAAESVSKNISAKVWTRNSEVRRFVLERSGGRCEQCGSEGFQMLDGTTYLETHHVIPLSEGGADSARNVVALCPNHHREAHFGLNSQRIRKRLLAKAARDA